MILGGQGPRSLQRRKEDPRIADKYGRGLKTHAHGATARRAGVTFVTVDMPHWDDHSNIKEGHGYCRTSIGR